MTDRKHEDNRRNEGINPDSSADDSLISASESETEIRPDTYDDIDEFAQALLNKKVELALYPEQSAPEEKTEPVLDQESRKEAETTLSNALDQLRRERGQLPIEAEEENFEWDQLDSPADDTEDFTTASIIQERRSNENATLTSLYDAKPDVASSGKDKKEYFEETETRTSSKKAKKASEKRKHSSKETRKSSARTRTGKNTERREYTEKTAHSKMPADSQRYDETAAGASSVTPDKAARWDAQPETILQEQPSGGHARKKKLRKKAVWTIVGIAALVLLLFGGYVYKVKVYDPANAVSEAQAASYTKLQQYADEYDMASEAEKMELLDLADDYNALSEKQKEEIGTYFQEQTGMTYFELRDQLQKQKDQEESNSSEAYTTLLDYVNRWGELSDEEKEQIADKISDYESLTDYQKGRIDQIMEDAAGTSFMDEANAMQQVIQKREEEAAQAAKNEENGAYQEIIDNLIADRSSYAEFLAEEGMEYDDVMAEYDASIEYYQNLQNSGQ